MHTYTIKFMYCKMINDNNNNNNNKKRIIS